jgi:DNA-binding NtrC family response regulator
VDAVLSDVAMPEMDGIELVRRIRETDATLPIILMTAYATIERATLAIRAGATEFLTKPVNIGALSTLLERAVAERPVREAVAARREADQSIRNFLSGSDPALDGVRNFAEQLARVPQARVLITGESGTGKSLLARAIHELSAESGRFVEVSSAALPVHLIESELFGHEKGAFTDAKSTKRGLFELADRGTIFLDEIGTLPLEVQAKLLLCLENRECRRVGGMRTIPIRARVITATNEDLSARVRDRTFRQDLFYRLEVASIHMPPLRSMPKVIVELAEHFTREICREQKRLVPPITAASFAALVSYDWPGNARELRNAVERALIFYNDGPYIVQPPTRTGPPLRETSGVKLEFGLTLTEVERRYLSATLAADQSEFRELALALGISRKTLWEKRRRFGL